MLSSQFEKSQLKLLAHKLKCNTHDLQYVLDHIPEFYKERNELKKGKDGIVKRYKDGTPKIRTICEATGLLKKMQAGVKAAWFDDYKFPKHIQGSAKGKSNISNAKLHQGKKFRLTTDLKDYFPSVNSEMVFHAFLKFGISDHMAQWLTILTTLKNQLPQGTHTSPFLSNICFLPVDYLLIKICQQNGLTYSRFIDDLTFSKSSDFQDVIPVLLGIIRRRGFIINPRKTSYSNYDLVTGIVVSNNYIDAPAVIKEKAALEKLTGAGLGPYSIYFDRIQRTNSSLRQK